MFKIDSNKTIHITRGDIGTIEFSIMNGQNPYTFTEGDIVRLGVFNKKNMNSLVFQKDVQVTGSVTKVDIELTEEDTKIGDIINKPVEYWYEIQLNPDTEPQTIIGYDDLGAKVFKLYPEGIEATE